MAFPALNPSLPLPTFKHLVLRDSNTVGEGIEEQLMKNGPRDEYETMRKQRKQWEETVRVLVQETLEKGGMPDPDMIRLVEDAEKTYLPARDGYLGKAEFAHLNAPFSRSQYDVTPRRYPNRNNLANTNPFWTSAMWDVFPGSDQEHCDLLQRHRADMHFCRRVAALGGVFVTPPDFDKENDASGDPSKGLTRLRALMEAMLEADPYWHVPPKLFPDTTVETAKSIFQHYEDDWPATVEDTGGTVLGYVDQDMIAKAPDRNRIHDYMEKDIPWAENPRMTADEAYAAMTGGSKKQKYVLRHLPGRDPEMISVSSAIYSSLLPPFKYQDGLGFVLYLGVSDPARTARIVQWMEEGALRGVRNPDRVLRAPGVMIDTAHAFVGSVEKLLKDIRTKHADLFLAAGAFNNPQAVSVLKDTVDMMKGPIGSGGVCNTYHTGIAVPDAFALLEMAVMAETHKMPLLADGMGGGGDPDPRFLEAQMVDTLEQNVKLAIPSVAGLQGGGAHIALHTSPNPAERHNGHLGKFGDGEAGYRANQRPLRGNGAADARAKVANLQYSEGVSRRHYPLRKPEHLAAQYWLRLHRLRSAYSYVFSRLLVKNGEALPPGETMRRFQENAVILHKG